MLEIAKHYSDIIDLIGKWEVRQQAYCNNVFVGALYIYLSSTDCIEIPTTGFSTESNHQEAIIDAFINAVEKANLA